LIVRELIDAFVCAGARIATPGEFTRRAILNGKINLMKVEGIRGLIESQSHKALECAQKLYSGSTKGISELREKILEILAYTEAQIEFEEEADTIRNDKQKIIDLVELLKKDLYKGERIDALDNGWRVVIAGPVNAGKSTLFNALLGKERAIVHNEAGTTRDFISERVFISNTEICLVDTAGLRVVDHEIEKEGINRSRIEIERADFIIWVTAADQALEEEESTLLSALKKKNLFCIINKIDLASGKKKREFFDNMSLRVLRTSFKNQQNHDEVMLVIDEIRNRSQTDVETPNLLLNKRHRESGRRICDELLCAEKNWDRQEIVSYHLKNALAVLDEIFGKTGSDEVMNRVFSGFCIGK
jgi:tRNA modification GTPase